MRFMKNYQTLAVLTLGVALALPGLAESYTSASYVQQEHLIAQWDGIDNAGTRVHDPNATVWKDLKGNLDMTLTTKGRHVCRLQHGDREISRRQGDCYRECASHGTTTMSS